MGLRGIFRAELPEIFGEFGDDEAPAEDAIYTPVGGEPKNCKIFIEFGGDQMPPGLESRMWQRTITIEALLSDDEEIGIGTALPGKGDTFEYEGTVYTVQRINETDGLTATMTVK